MSRHTAPYIPHTRLSPATILAARMPKPRQPLHCAPALFGDGNAFTLPPLKRRFIFIRLLVLRSWASETCTEAKSGRRGFDDTHWRANPLDFALQLERRHIRT